MFKVRNLTYEDYDNLLVKWWEQWKWTAPARGFLPQDGTGGIVVEVDGIPVVAGFVYLTNSKVAWSEFIISNFEYKDKVKRKEAIELIISDLCRIAKTCGAKYVYTSVKNPSLIKHYEKIGFVLGSKKVDEMICLL